jgi:hypothetical protein
MKAMTLHPRFRLRTLLFLTAVVALGLYYIDRPTAAARRFARALREGDRAIVRAMLVQHATSPILTEQYLPWSRVIHMDASVARPTSAELLSGARRLSVSFFVDHPEEKVVTRLSYDFRATAREIKMEPHTSMTDLPAAEWHMWK